MLEKRNISRLSYLLNKMKPSPTPSDSNSDSSSDEKYGIKINFESLKKLFTEYLFGKRTEDLCNGDLPSIIKDLRNHLIDVHTDVSDESDVIKQQKTEEKRVRRQQENLARKQSGKEMQVDELSDSSASSQSSTRSTLKSLKYNIDCMNKIMSNKPDEALSDDEKTVLQIEFNRYLKFVSKKSEEMKLQITVQLLKDLGCLEKLYTLLKARREKEEEKAVEKEKGEQNIGEESIKEKRNEEQDSNDDETSTDEKSDEEAPPSEDEEEQSRTESEDEEETSEDSEEPPYKKKKKTLK